VVYCASMDEDKNITSNAGHALERYKLWYLEQPKFVRIVLFPFPLTILVIIIETLSLNGVWFIAPAMLLFANLYNQYLDVIVSDEAEGKLSSVKRQRDRWTELSSKLMFLNNVLKELVEEKSSQFLKTVETATNHGNEAAYEEIRNSSSFDKSLDRIVAMVYKVFENHADTNKDQQFRVTYLVPDETGRRLRVVASCNPDRSMPASVDNAEDGFFTSGGRTLAGHLWGRSGHDIHIIDDVENDIKKHGDKLPFIYSHAGQKSYLKSIMCYKVTDKIEHEVLGFMCVDSNVHSTFIKNQRYYKIVLDAFSKRVLFETRNAYMKSVLNEGS